MVETRTKKKYRIKKGSTWAGGLMKIQISKTVFRRVKLRNSKTVNKPMVTYPCETWPNRKKMEELLDIWKRKMLRPIFGGKNV